MSIDAKLVVDDKAKEAADFQSNCTSQIKYSSGKRPPSDGRPETWMEETPSDPEPLTLTLTPLDEIHGLDHVVYNVIVQNLGKFLKNDYCLQLKNDGDVARCNAPGPDPPFPKGT